MEYLTQTGKHLESVGLVAIIAILIGVAAWRAVRAFKKLSTEERNRTKKLIALSLLLFTGVTPAAAILFLYGGIVNAIKGNFGEFKNMMAIGVSLAVLSFVLWWVTFRWPDWSERSAKGQ